MRVLYHFFYKLQEKVEKSINIRFPTINYTKKNEIYYFMNFDFSFTVLYLRSTSSRFLYFLIVLVVALPSNTRCKNFGWYPYHYFFNCIVYYIPQYKKLTFFYLSSSQLWRWQHPISAFVLWFTSNVSCKRSSVCVTNI